MAYSPIQTSFAAGELSPKLRGRVDLPAYATGLAYCENLIPLPHGGLVSRNGLEYVTEIAGALRIASVRMPGGKIFLLVFGDETLSIYDSAGAVQTTANLVVNGTFSSGLSGWVNDGGDWTELLTVYLGRLRIACIEPGASDETFHGHGHQDIAVAVTGNHTFAFDLEVKPEGGAIKLRVIVTDGAVVRMDETFNEGFYGRVSRSLALTAGNTCRIEFLDASNANNDTWAWGSFVDNVILTQEAVDPTMTAPWTADQVDAVQFVEYGANGQVIFVHPQVAPWALTYDQDTGAWAFAAIVFVSPAAEWIAGNYPGVVEVFQSRLWLSGTPHQSNKVWASKSGEIFDFGGDGTIASHRLIVNVTTKGPIRWLRGQKNLLCGTDEGEHSFVAQGGVLWQGDFEAVPESAFGAAEEMAVRAGNQVLFVSADRRKVRALGFDLQTDGWVQRDLTFPGEHLTEDLIEELHFAKDPQGAIVLLVGGAPIVGTYDLAAEVLAWWRFSTGSPTVADVVSMAVSNGPSGSAVWALVERSNGTMLELTYLSPHGLDVPLDSRVTKLVAADGSVSGLTHLEGETVAAVIGTTVVSGLAVAAGVAQVGIAFAGQVAVVGLPFPAMKAITLRPEGGNPRGSSAGAKRRYSRIAVRLNDSALPLINGSRPPDRTPSSPMDEGEPLFTGDVEMNELGWTEGGQITIEQDLPLRTEVVALFGVVQVNQT